MTHDLSSVALDQSKMIAERHITNLVLLNNYDYLISKTKLIAYLP